MGRVIAMERRRKADPENVRVRRLVEDQVACTVRLDLTDTPYGLQRHAVGELYGLPTGTRGEIAVPDAWPAADALNLLAYHTATQQLRLDVQGTPEALRQWVPELRRIIRGHHLGRREHQS